MTLNVTQGHQSYSTARISFPIRAVTASCVAPFQRYYHFCRVRVTACDFEKSFSFNRTSWNYRPRALSDPCVNTSYLIRAVFPEVWELEKKKGFKLQTAKVTFKVRSLLLES